VDDPGVEAVKTVPRLVDRPAWDPAALGLSPAFRLPRYAELRGRSCRPPSRLARAPLGFLGPAAPAPPEEGAGPGVATDCTIVPIRLGGLSQLTTSDLFYPVVEDPYVMGRIACSSLLSDLYAMGVQDVDNILMYLGVCTKMSEAERDKIVPLMLEGFKDCAREAGTRVTGGHTLLNPWLFIGGVATSVSTVEEYIVPDGALVGDVLVLTKPLGTGVALNVQQWRGTERWGRIKLVLTDEEAGKAFRRAVDTMARTNRTSALLMHKYSAHGATDISGLGLLGHAQALAGNQQNEVSFVIHNLPVIAKMGAVARACGNMFSLLQGQASECSGGLLICLPREQAAAYCKDIERLEGFQSWIIGIVEKGDRTARIIEKPRVIEVPNKDKEDELW